MLTICVSGPQSSRTKALKTLKDAGFHVVLNDVGDPSDYDWGHDHGETEQFLTVEHEDHNRAVEVLEPLKWRLRSHRDAPEAVRAPTVEERLAAVGLSLGDLRTALGV